MTGRSPAEMARTVLRATHASVSPKISRRSECPTMTAPAPTSSSIGAETSPVNAPERSEEHTSELQSRQYLVCRLLLEKKKKQKNQLFQDTTQKTNTTIT